MQQQQRQDSRRAVGGIMAASGDYLQRHRGCLSGEQRRLQRAEAQLAIVPSASELLQLVGERLIARGRAQLRRDEPVEQRRQRRQRPAGLAVDEHFSAASALRRYLIEGRVEPAAEVVVLASRLDDQIVERGDAALVLLLEAARHAGGMI